MRNSLIAAILVLSGCTQNAENVTFHEELVHQFGEQKTLIHSETRTILIDSLSLPFYDYFQLINRDESPYLVGFNRQSVSLDFIPLRQGDAIDHLVFADDGPNAVDADLDIIHLFSEDSIVTIQDRALRFKVLNREGKLINSYRKTIRDFKGVEMYPVSYSYLGQWPVFLDSVWVLPVYPDLNVKKKLYYERNKFMIYDPVKDEVVDEFGAYPQMYRGDNYFDVLREPNLTPTPQGTFLVTFPADPGIYEYQLDSDTVIYHRYEEWGRFFNEGVDRDADLQQFVNHYISSAWFQQLIYDPFREVYYRFGKEQQDLRKSDGEKNTAFDAEWKIFLLDKDLNPMGAYSLDSKRFNPLFTFVSKEGLFIYDNQREHDDEMVFGIFQLSDY
ncbi:protein of unknown function [Algoriphagus hitonicola]|uniref:DUF4221 domain-containing protein n=1 Tax=Algoriphagus hitonicola TaxID=435880 RepID=A0A1I2T136_9BACT|nr:DUF4221 family protein [Algoriphagus hitonicola]SFG58752.1 protein of unknown function [Algoriphagus hitonicola]